MFILPMLFGPFRPPMSCFSERWRANVFLTLKAEQALAAIGLSETFPRALLMLHDAQIRLLVTPR